MKTTIIDIIAIPGRDYSVFVGDKDISGIKIGDYLTDGEKKYKVSSIPTSCINSYKNHKLTDIILEPGDYNPRSLIGKTLYTT